MRPESSYWGLLLSLVGGAEVVAGAELVGATGSAAAGAACDVGATTSDLGGSGTVVIALSGFSRWSLLGPSPRVMSARESGTVLLCQPWSAWYRRMASSLAWFQVPFASPVR